MKKILYFSKYYLHKKFALKDKFDNQMKALKNLGYDVWYIGCDENSIYLIHDNKKIKLISLYATFIPKYENTILHIRLSQAVKYAVKNHEFDFVYMRNVFTTPFSIAMIKEMKRNKIKTIIEIPTYPMKRGHKAEKRLLRRIIFKINHQLRKILYKYVDLFAIIGEDAGGSHYGKPAVNIVNGFDVSSVPIRKKKVDKSIHLLALANMSNWHGYDRIIEGLKNYKKHNNKEKIIVHFIGPDGDGSLKEWRNLVKKYNLNDSVIFEGSKYGKELNHYFNKCGLAIGSLGRHRTGHKYLCTLKVREYMARGIPFILSHTDLALKSNLDYFLKVPSNDEPIDIERLIQFIKNNQKKSDISIRMRNYAKENMGWEKQFVKIFNHFDN